MPRPILIDQQQQVETVEQEAAKKKQYGANPKTVGVLAAMAKNHTEFVQMCDQWEDGKAAIRKKKKRFEELQAGDKVPPDHASTDAWSNRPLNCTNLRAAMVIRAKFFRKERDEAFRSSHILRLDDPQERNATLAATKALLNSKIHALGKSMAKLNAAKANSMIPTEFPYAYCFLKQQEASRRLKIIERRDGGPMDTQKRNIKFPELVRGWPDKVDPRLRFEIENEARERREAKQREQERLLEEEGEEEGEEESESEEEVDENEPEDDIVLDSQELHAAPLKDPLVDRRFEPEANQNKPKYKKQPKSQVGFNPGSPSLLKAAEEEAAALGPVNEGKKKGPKKRTVDEESEAGDVAGSSSVNGSEDEASSEPRHKRSKIVPQEQGAAFNAIFGEGSDDESDDEAEHSDARSETGSIDNLVMGEDGIGRMASPPPEGFEDSDAEEGGY